MVNKDIKQEIERLIDKALGELSLAGLKGESIYPTIIRIIDSYRMRKVQREEKYLTDVLEKLKEDLGKHMVVKSEKDIENELAEAVHEFAILYLVLHGPHLLEKRAILDLKEMVERNQAHFKGSSEAQKAFRAVVLEALGEWYGELKQERQKINAVWASAHGRGTTKLQVFKKLHEEGTMAAFAERRLLRKALKNEKLIKNNAKQLAGIKTTDELKRKLAEISQEEKEETCEFGKLWSFIETTWEHINDKLNELVGVVCAAVEGYELPKKDAEVREIKIIIVNKLEEKFLHGLQIELEQLEQLVSEVHAKVA